MMPTIDVLLSWLATLGPGLAVYSVSHCLVKVEDSTSHRLILYSTSHLLGLLLLSLYVLASLLLEMQTFNNYARATFIALPALSTGTLLVFGGRDRYQALKIIATHMAFVVLFAVTWGSVPIFGWDSLSYWVSSATPLIEALTGERPFKEITISSLAFTHRHGPTLPLLNAWLGWLNSHHGLSTTSVHFGPHLAYLIACLIFACWLRATNERVHALLAAGTFLSMPLVENHTIIYGYAELWIIWSCLGALASFVAFDESNNRNFLTLFLICLVALILFKNVGWIIAALIGYSAIGHLAFNQQQAPASTKKPWVFVIITTVSFTITASLLAIFSGSDVQIFGKTLIVEMQSFSEIFRSLFHALVVNSSFFLIGIFCVGLFLYRTVTLVRLTNEEMPDVFFIFCCVFACSLLIFYAFFPYGLKYALPGSDTSGSRILLLLIAVIMAAPPKHWPGVDIGKPKQSIG